LISHTVNFKGRNTPRKVFSQGFKETLRIGYKKDDANLAAFDGTQSLLQTKARTQSLFVRGLVKKVAAAAQNVVQHVEEKVNEAHQAVVDKLEDVKNAVNNVVALPRVNMPVPNPKTSPNVESDNFYMEANGVIEVKSPSPPPQTLSFGLLEPAFFCLVFFCSSHLDIKIGKKHMDRLGQGFSGRALATCANRNPSCLAKTK
jgi:hypothetical protein